MLPPLVTTCYNNCTTTYYYVRTKYLKRCSSASREYDINSHKHCSAAHTKYIFTHETRKLNWIVMHTTIRSSHYCNLHVRLMRRTQEIKYCLLIICSRNLVRGWRVTSPTNVVAVVVLCTLVVACRPVLASSLKTSKPFPLDETAEDELSPAKRGRRRRKIPAARGGNPIAKLGLRRRAA